MKERETSRQGSDLVYTGERHMIAQPGVELSLGHIDHMVRYASVAPFIVGKRVLDVACGSGYGSQFLALQGAHHVVGIDIHQATIEYARKCHADPNVTYLRADTHALPLAESGFDVIVSFETIEHVQRPRDFLIELRRVLKPGGQCFISCPNDYRPSPWISEFHVNRFKFKEFCDLIVLVFGDSIFLGQHNTCTSSLLKPRAVSERHVLFEAYRQPLPAGFFGNQYLDSISSIDDAAGYFAVVGMESSSFANQVSASENSFQQMLTSMHSYTEEAKKAQLETVAVKQEIAEIQQQMEAEKSLRAELEAARAQELATLRQLQEQEIAHREHVLSLERQLETEHGVRTEIETARAQEIAMVQQQMRAESELHRHERTQAERQLSDLRDQVRALQQDRVRAEALAQELRSRIAAMESSKFWKLRRMWFRLKGAVGLTAE